MPIPSPAGSSSLRTSGGCVEFILNILGDGRWVDGVEKAYYIGLFQYSITDTPVFVRSRIKVTSSHPSSPMLFITSEVDVVPPVECLIKWIVSLYSHCCMTQL